MTKNEMKDLLFEILNEHDSLFSDLTLNDALNALIVTSIDKEKFIITVNHLEQYETANRLWTRKNFTFLTVEMALIQMADLGIITEDERRKYHLEVSKYLDSMEDKDENSET